MKKKIYALALVFLFIGQIMGQYTAIPDANFEQKLIDLGIDSEGTLDGQMLTNDALLVYGLDVSNSSISDLTGIEIFTDVVTLQVQGNSLTTLDVTSNTNIMWFNCYNNNLTSLNTTGLTALKSLECYGNSLTALDVTTNTALENLVFSNNSVTTIDLTQNTALKTLVCSSNALLSLDLTNNTALTKVLALTNNLGFNDPNSFKIKNGNNTNIATADFDIRFNWNTMCIEVDDVAWSNANWTNKQVHHTYSTNCAALPVKLLDFSAIYKNKMVYLNWATASEVNNKGFEIEASTNGQHWRKIEFIEGNGNSVRLNRYSVVDRSPEPGVNYYRLLQQDNDGAYQYAQTISVQVGQSPNIRVTPNPATDQISISGLESVQAKVKVMNLLGEVVLEKNIDDETLDVAGLNAGMYIVMVETSAGLSKSVQFIKK